MATFLVCHGAWSAGFAWRKMHPLMRAAGHALVTPTCTGLGERHHLARPEIDLEHHIRDILAVIEIEDLSDIVLVGHSYGGMVATGVADRVPEKLRQLVYLDAFVPRHGQCLLDLLPPSARERMLELAAETGEGWQVPPNPTPPDTAPEDVAWLAPRRRKQPLQTFAQGLQLARGETRIPRAYVYCTRIAPGDVFGQFSARAKAEAGWRHEVIEASHSPHVTAPEALRDLLCRLAA